MTNLISDLCKKKIILIIQKNKADYKSEKLSPEGFQNAKITDEITDADIQKEIEEINSIIIKVIYNDKIEQKKLFINNKNKNNNLIVNEKFEFKPIREKILLNLL